MLHGYDIEIDNNLVHSRMDYNNDQNSKKVDNTENYATWKIMQNLPSPCILYIDLDIHHPDGVQSTFYSTDRVLMVSFHCHLPNFLPASSGSIHEKGRFHTCGPGYNLNVPLPAGIVDSIFFKNVSYDAV